MAKIDTIIYDLDGTLVDTNDIIVASFRSAFQDHFPKMDLSLDTIKTFIGPPLETTFRNYTKDPFKIQDMINAYRSYYIEYEKDNISLYPGVLETIKELKKQGYQLAILTSKTREAAWPSFTKTGLSDLFDVFVGLDDVKNPKPHKGSVETVLKQFKSAKNAIMIGDNQGDILAGKNAFIYSAGVAWTFKGVPHLMQVEPDYILHKMSDIFDVLNKIKGETLYG